MRNAAALLVLVVVGSLALGEEGVVTKNVIGVSGTGFKLNGERFDYTGVSFFNAIYNPSFNRSSEERGKWLGKFRKYGINVLRVWCQWDNRRGFVDGGEGRTMYEADGGCGCSG